MNLKDLRYVIAVAEHRHFGHAAEACHVTQPTLSGQVKKLEDELGVILFERTKRSVVVTPMGEEVLRHARQAVEHAEQIVALARARRDPMTGPLHLGVIPTLSPYLMPLILRPLRQRYPNLRLVLSEEITDRLLIRLHNHEIDVALLATTVEEPDLCELPLFDEPFWLAHPRQHALYDKDEIEPTDLVDLELLLLTDAHCLSGQVRDVCAAAGHSDPTGIGDLRTASTGDIAAIGGGRFRLYPGPGAGNPGQLDHGCGCYCPPDRRLQRQPAGGHGLSQKLSPRRRAGASGQSDSRAPAKHREAPSACLSKLNGIRTLVRSHPLQDGDAAIPAIWSGWRGSLESIRERASWDSNGQLHRRRSWQWNHCYLRCAA